MVIFEAPRCTKTNFFGSLLHTLLGELTAFPHPLYGGEGLVVLLFKLVFEEVSVFGHRLIDERLGCDAGRREGGNG